MTLTPAYGRDYKSKAEVLKDWNEGKDFVNTFGSGTYCNKADAEKYAVGESVFIRYAKLTKVVQVK